MSKKNPIDLVGERIRKIREKLEYTQAKLASEAQITPAAISQIESGDRIPSTPILRRLASVLKVSTDYLLGSTDGVELQDLMEDQDVQNFYRGFKDLDVQDKAYIQKQVELLKGQKSK